jgi:ABC-type nitrate/sulfonate/bicarbonate transport system permease component
MQRVFRVPEMFAGIFTLGLLGFAINFMFLKVEGYLLRWRGTSVET